MSVETALGITSQTASRIIGGRWADWSADHPALAPIPPSRAQEWLRATSPEDSNEVLRVIARMASETGGDDLEAAELLAWILMPAARRVAVELANLIRDEPMDHIVAAQLWIEIRTFNWKTNTLVAGCVRRNLRKHVLVECGAIVPDVMSRRTVLLDDPDDFDLLEAPPEAPAPVADQLEVLLALGVRAGTIQEAHRVLLEEMVDAAYSHPSRLRPLNPLLAVADVVAMRRGVTGRHVRRLSRRALDALARDAEVLLDGLGRIA